MNMIKMLQPLAWAALLAVMPCATVQALNANPPEAAAVTVTLGDFSQMRELKHMSGFQRSDTERAITSLARWLERRAARRLPSGQQLEITLHDVDLAGDYEPGRSLDHDIRIIKDIYPPRIDLSYRLNNADGTVLREGEASLRDMGFLFSASPLNSEPLRHEQRLLNEWLREQFPR